MIGDAYKLDFDKSSGYECREYWPQLRLNQNGSELELTFVPSWTVLQQKFHGIGGEGLLDMTLIDELPPTLVYAAALYASECSWTNTAHRLEANMGPPRDGGSYEQRQDAVSFVNRTIKAHMETPNGQNFSGGVADFHVHSQAGRFWHCQGWKHWCAINRMKGYMKDVPVPHRLAMTRDTANQQIIRNAMFSHLNTDDTMPFDADDIRCPQQTMPLMSVQLSARSSDRHYTDKFPPFVRHAYEQYYYDDLARRSSGSCPFNSHSHVRAFFKCARRAMAEIFYAVTAETGDPMAAAYWQRCAASSLIRKIMKGKMTTPGLRWNFKVVACDKTPIGGLLTFASNIGLRADFECKVRIAGKDT